MRAVSLFFGEHPSFIQGYSTLMTPLRLSKLPQVAASDPGLARLARRHRRRAAELQKSAVNAINRRRASGGQQKDLLGLLLAARGWLFPKKLNLPAALVPQ